MSITNNRSDIDAEVQRLKDRIASANRRRIRAEHDRDAATAQADKARQQLQRDFGVSTVAEAQTKLAELRAELDAEVAALRGELEQFEA